MRPKMLNFEQLVNQNREELLEDEEMNSQFELRLAKKQTEASNSKEQNA
ncbi:FbpB family small basic protein [Virgibacillus ihumii]|nr:FbpB family small basic protein [Virgibacillus ihumii]